MERWAFTIKDNRVDSTDYNQFFDLCKKNHCVIDCSYKELDKKGKLHLHGIINIPKECYRKKLLPNGLHMKLKMLFNEQGWDEYITKDQRKKTVQPPDMDFYEYNSGDEEDQILMNKLKKKLF